MPYEKAEFTKNAEDFEKYYDYVIVCPESAKAHPKQAIQVRNRWIVDKSDLVVFWVENNSGGAYMTMKYAEKEKVETINLAGKIGHKCRCTNIFVKYCLYGFYREIVQILSKPIRFKS